MKVVKEWGPKPTVQKSEEEEKRGTEGEAQIQQIKDPKPMVEAKDSGKGKEIQVVEEAQRPANSAMSKTKGTTPATPNSKKIGALPGIVIREESIPPDRGK